MSETSKRAAISNLHKEYLLETALDELMAVADPDEILREKGIHRHELVRLLNDEELYSLIETRQGKATSVPWRLDRIGDNEQWIADQIKKWIDSVLINAWSANLYGYSVQQLKLVKRDGRSEIDFVQDVPIEYFQINQRADLIVNVNGKHEVVDTDFQFILTRKNPSYKNPYGEALLSRAYWIWFFRHNGWRFYMNFLERFSDPLVIGSVNDPAEFKEAMYQAGFASVLALNVDESAEAITQTSNGEFQTFEQMVTKRYQKLIMGQSGTSEIGNNGSRAAIEVQKQESDDSRMIPDIKLIQPAGQHLVNVLWIANKFPNDPPVFLLQEEKGLEKDRADRDKTLSTLGIRHTKEYYAANYGLNKDEFELVEPVHNDDTDVDDDQSAQDKTLSRGGRPTLLTKSTDAQANVDQIIDDTIESIPDHNESITQIVLNAESPDDMRLKLIAFAANNPTSSDVIERALRVADITGYVSHAEGVATDD